jgi:hypothetical protein
MTPPWMTMDSKIQIRAGKNVMMSQIECSQKFSPLDNSEGNATHPREATGEGDTVQQVLTLRARVEDHGNTAPGLMVETFSDVDTGSVKLYVIPDDGSTALAVDTDGDPGHVCDDLNPQLTPGVQANMSGQALEIDMMQLKVGGSFDFSLGTNDNGACNYVGESPTPAQPPLCNNVGTVTTGVIPWPPGPSGVGAIYSIDTMNTNMCVGLQLDSLNKLPEGPTCAVTRATDRAGNTTVSYPLHFCIDRGGGKCSGWTPTASHCTGRWDKTAMMPLPGSCIEATPMVPGATLENEPNPGTFPKDGEVRLIN